MDAQMMAMIAQGAQQTQSTAIGTGMSWLDEWLMGDNRRKKQLEQQGKLTQIQEESNKRLGAYGMDLQKQMWDYTNYENQRKHMENAGLNPALMYGSAGAGGTTGSGAVGSAGIGHASSESERKQADIAQQGMALQMGMQQTMLEKLKAETKKVNAEAEKISTVDSELTARSIDKIVEETQNTRATRRAIELQNDLQEFNNSIAKKLENTTIEKAISESNYVRQQYMSLMQQYGITENVKSQIEESYKQQVQKTALEMLGIQTATEKQKAEIWGVFEQLRQSGEMVNINDFKARTERWKTVMNDNRAKESNEINKAKNRISEIYQSPWNMATGTFVKVVAGVGELLGTGHGYQQK